MGRCEEMLPYLSLIDKEFASTMKYDADEF